MMWMICDATDTTTTATPPYIVFIGRYETESTPLSNAWCAPAPEPVREKPRPPRWFDIHAPVLRPPVPQWQPPCLRHADRPHNAPSRKCINRSKRKLFVQGLRV